ncbi:MAG: sulfatase-like hydrolase/transferase, partial [Planctomycetota bacterium]
KDPYNFVRNGVPVGPLKGYAADIVAGDAARWLKEERDPGRPFFLYVCFHEPHEPITTAPYYAGLYDHDDPRANAYYGNVTQMDHAFGRLMNTLDSLNLTDSTFVLFTSDNGPAQTRYHPHGSPGPLREKKGHVYDGGIRVPGILRWPGRIEPNSVSSQPVCGVDLLPTLCDIAGAPVPADRAIDGASLLPLFEGKSIRRATPLYWQYSFAPSEPKVAMRIGDWKILAQHDGPKRRNSADITDDDMRYIKTARLTGFELYNLARDIGEAKNLAAAVPERLQSMSQQLKDLHREVQQEFRTWPAWTSPRYEQRRIEWPVYEGVE